MHSYWWDRAIELERSDLRYRIIDELALLISEFEELNSIVNEKVRVSFLSKGLNMKESAEEFKMLNSTPGRNSYVRISKSETLTALYLLQKDNMQTLIFELEGKGNWILSEVGLSKFERSSEQELIPYEPVQEVLPVQQFNPRPKLIGEWHYDLDLKKSRLFIKVRPLVFNN